MYDSFQNLIGNLIPIAAFTASACWIASCIISGPRYPESKDEPTRRNDTDSDRILASQPTVRSAGSENSSRVPVRNAKQET